MALRHQYYLHVLLRLHQPLQRRLHLVKPYKTLGSNHRLVRNLLALHQV